MGERDDRAGRFESGVRAPVVRRQRFDDRQLHAATRRRRHGARDAHRGGRADVGRAGERVHDRAKHGDSCRVEATRQVRRPCREGRDADAAGKRSA